MESMTQDFLVGEACVCRAQRAGGAGRTADRGDFQRTVKARGQRARRSVTSTVLAAVRVEFAHRSLRDER
jgi:hypothetical protein